MPYLLDGDNLARTPGPRGLGGPQGPPRGSPGNAGDRDALVSQISDRLRHTRARVVLFFDGAGKPLSLGNLSVRFSGAVSADDAIVREVSRSSRPHEATVVTADRELARRARDAGAVTLSPGDFWKRFGTRHSAEPKHSGPPSVDVEDWIEWFSDERNRAK